MQVDLLKENILASLIKLSVPLMATAFVQVTYNIVDMLWLGRLGTEAVAAAGTVGTYVWLVNTFMMMPRIGVSIRGSQAYGAGNYEKTRTSFQNAIQLAIILSIITTSICLALKRPLIEFFALDTLTESLAIEYFGIIAFGFLFSYLNPVLSACYNSLGNSLTPFKYNVIGLVTNIILDPVLIFGLGPFPELGISGAALATVLAQVLVTVLFIFYIRSEKDLVYESKITKRPSLREISRIISLGLPGALRSAVQAVVALILNKFTSNYGATPIAAYSIGTQIESISYMTSDGFATAMTAFTGQNYGARQYDRIKRMARQALSIMFIFGLIIMVIFIIFGKDIFQIFLPNDEEAIILGAYYLIILGVSQPLMNIEIGTTGIFNGIDQTKFPGFVGIVFNILRVPMAMILMKPFGVLGIWTAITISSCIKGIINFIALNYFMKKARYRNNF